MTRRDLYRTKRGARMTVHRTGCRVLAKVPAERKWPWAWAEGRPRAEVFRSPWNVPCRVCAP